MADESERWLKGLGKQSSIKSRWPHGQGKPGEPSKPPSGIRRSSSSDSQDGSSSERSQYNTRSRTGEISGRVGARSKTVVPAQVETTQSITRPRTSPQVQQIPQPTPLQVTPKPPTETQPSTTRPFIGGKQPTTQSSFHTTSTYTQPSKLKPVVLKSKSHSSEGHQTSEGASAHPANSTPSMPPHLVHTVQGHLPSTTTAAASESLALVSVSEVAGQEREEDWLVVSQGDVPSHIEGVQIPPQQQVSEARAESGTDLQAAKKIQEYRKQREAAHMEIKVLQGQLAQSKTEIEQGGNKVARCERKIHELETEVSDMNAKHEAHIKQLRQEFESILAQKDESSGKAVARARSFGRDPSASAQQQLEASYQAKIQQKEKEFHENEREFLRKQRHYLTQIAQLEEGRDEAKTREGELRGEMERMKMEYQSQLHKLSVSMPDSSLDEDSRCPSNPIVCQPTSTDVESKVVTGGVEHTSVELQHFQRILSREQVDIKPAELASLGARERRTIQRKVQQLRNEVNIRDIDIKTLSDQLELKEKRITALRRTIEETRKTTEKGLRHQNEDSYLEQLTELTGQLSAFEASDRAQKNELAKLRVKVKEAEEVTGQLDGAVERMSDLETENQTLKQQVAKLQEHAVGEAAAQQSGGEITYQSYNREVMAELKRLQPLEAEVQHLRKELTEAQEFRAAAIKFESQVVNLITEVSEKEKQVSDLQSEKSQLEARIGALASRDVDGEIARMKEQLFAKEEELTRLKSERVGITGGQRDAGYAEDASRMKLQLELKEKENLKLKSQIASLAPSSKPTPKPRARDAATDQTTDQPPPLDPPTDVVELQKVLQEKEATIALMSQQLQQFEKTAHDLTKIVKHTKGQSHIVKELRQQLARAEGELKTEKDNLSAAKDSIQDEIGRLQKSCTGKETALIATQQENSRLKRQIDFLKGEKEQLEGRSSQLDSHLRRLQATMHQDAAKVSSEQGQRMALTVAKLDEVVKERNHLEQKTIALMAKFENTNQELARSRVEVTKLTTEVEQLCKEKADLQGELDAHKFTAQTFQEDFEQERKDREKAHSQVAEIEERYQHQLQSMVTQFNHTAQDLQKHKETLATTETLLHSQIEQLSNRLSDKDQQVATIAAENDRLHEEVLSKTQQVKQYKKQVDQYKEEVGAHKQATEMKIQQVETFARESEEWKSRAVNWKARHDTMEGEVQKERSRSAAFERKIADLEKVNDQLRQEARSFSAKAEPRALSHAKASPPMQRAHSSNEASGYNSQHARTSPLQKMKVHSVDSEAMLNSRGTDPYSQQTPVPRVVADNRASTLPAHTKQGAGSSHPQSALTQSYHVASTDYGGDGIGAFNKPPTLPPRARAAPPGLGGVPSTKPSVSVTSHTPSPGVGVGSVPATRPSIPAMSYSHTSSPYSNGGRSSNVATSRPPDIHHTVPPTVAGSYYYDPQSHIPRASTHRDAPSGYHPQQPQPTQSQRGTASPYHANLHPGYSTVSPSSLPPMSTISGEAESFRKHAYDDSSVYTGHPPDFVEKDSPPSSNVSSQSSQPPDASQQMPQYSGRGGSRQPQQQQTSYGVTAGGGNNQAGFLPSRFSPAGGFTNAPQPSQQPFRQQRGGTAYPMPHSSQASHQYPAPRSQFGFRGTNTSPNVLETPQSGPTPRIHSANVRRPVQETQQGPSGQPQPSSQAAYTTPNTSQPSRGMESNRLDAGIEREIYHVAKDVMKSDSEAPQTLGDEEIPYDPNLVCPKCHLKFRIGEIQKYRRHVKKCTVGGK